MMLALALALAAQAAPPPPPETTTPPAEAAPPEAAPEDAPPPVVPLAPATPPPPVTPPPSTPPPDHRPKAAPLEEKHGLDPFTTGAVQVAAGTGACCVGCCVSVVPVLGLELVPVVGTYIGGVVSDVIVGTFVGVSEGVAGDMFGQQRAALLWPVLTATGVLVVGSAAGTAVNLVSVASGINPPDPTDQTSINRYYAQAGPFVIANLAISCGTLAGALVLPAVVYGLTAVDKKPGDLGQGFPGFATPASPAPEPKHAVTVAMAY